MGEGIQYRQTDNGLYVPLHAWPVIHETLDYAEGLEKARSVRALSAMEEKTRLMYRRVGSLLSLFNYTRHSAYGATDKPAGTITHKMLRQLAEKSAVDAAIITARVYQVAHVAKRVIVEGKQKGFTVRHKRHSDPSFRNTSSVKAVAREIEDCIFKNLSREFHPGGFRDFLVKAVQDEMVIDRKVMIVQRDRRNRPLSYHLIPPDDVKPRLEVLWKYVPAAQGKIPTYRFSPEDHERAQAAIFAQFGIDVSDAAYVQEVDNVVMGAWPADECAVDVTMPTNEIDRAFYGRSSLERSLEVSALLMQAFAQNKNIFDQDMPDVLLMLHGEVDEAGLESFKRRIKAVGERGRVGVLPTGDAGNSAEVLKIRDTPRDMEMVQLIRVFTALKCFAYNTVVETEEGADWIGRIASQKRAVKVRSFNRETGEVCWSRVVDWQVQKATDWVTVWYPGGNKFRRLRVTKDHDVWNGQAMVEAGTLQVGDRIGVQSPTLTSEQEQVILGGLLGDASLQIRARCFAKRTSPLSCAPPSLSESHSELQRSYFEWKTRALSNLGVTTRSCWVTAQRAGTQKYAALQYTTRAVPVLYQYQELCCEEGSRRKRFSWEWLSRLTPLGLAVWFMDDGNYHQSKVGSQKTGMVANLTLMPSTADEVMWVWRYFAERWQLYPRMSPLRKTGKAALRGTPAWRLRFSVRDSMRLCEILSPYLVPAEPHSKYTGVSKYWLAEDIPVGQTEGVVTVPVLHLERHHYSQGKPCYDVTVENTHTLFAARVASSNCSYYRAHPSLVNFNPDKGADASPVISNSNDSFEMDLSQEEGLGALLENTAQWLTHELIEPCPDWEEYEVVVDLPKQMGETELTQLWSEKTAAFCTVDTALAAQGLPSLADQTGGRVRGDYVNNQFYFQAQQAQQAEKQQEIQELMAERQEKQQGQGGWTMGDEQPQQSGSVEKSWRLE